MSISNSATITKAPSYCTFWSRSSLSPPRGLWCNTRAQERRRDYDSSYRLNSYQDTWKIQMMSTMTKQRSNSSGRACCVTLQVLWSWNEWVLFRLVDVLVRILLVPSLTLSAAHGVVHLPPVVLSVTCDTHLCKQDRKRSSKVRRGVTRGQRRKRKKHCMNRNT